MNMSLLELSKKYKTDKEVGHNYITNFYEKKFFEYKSKPITLVEVGVEYGESMRLWADYFDQVKLIGLDNNKKNLPTIKNFSFMFGDAYDKKICCEVPNADVIIDDGPHDYISQIKFIMLYLPKLNKNGILVIEDIQKDHLYSVMGVFDDLVELMSKNLDKKYKVDKVFPNEPDPSILGDSNLYCVRRIS